MREMPDVIYALERETPSYRGIWDGYQWSDQSGTEYHHSRIVEALQEENKRLIADLRFYRAELDRVCNMLLEEK